jgi:putative copper export protein
MSTMTPLRSALAPWLLGSTLVALVVLVLVLEAGGGAPVPSPPGLPDAGPLTGWGLPVLRLLVDLTGFACVGLTLVGTRAIRVEPGAPDDALTAAAAVAAVWAVLAVLQGLLYVSDLLATPVLGDLGALRTLTAGLASSAEAQAMLVQAALAACVVFVAGLGRGATSTGVALGLSLAAFVPPALVGHAATGDRLLGMSTLVVHVGAAALWVGGLAALAWAALRGRAPLAHAVPRYSTLALGCVLAVAVSGVLNAGVRLGWSASALLGSTYGMVVLAKVAALLVLAGFGWLHRQHTVDVLRGWRRRRNVPGAAPVFVALAAIELALMAATVALGVGLARTPPPVPEGAPGAVGSSTAASVVSAAPRPCPC